MKTMLAAALVSFVASGTFAADHEDMSAETVTAIMAKLDDMKCQMDPDDIEVEDDGFDLDDVICEGGQQFDILLDKDLNEVSRRAE